MLLHAYQRRKSTSKSDISGHFRVHTYMTLTLTLDGIIRHTVVYHSSTCVPAHQISFKSETLYVGGRTDIETGLIMPTRVMGILYYRTYKRQGLAPWGQGQWLIVALSIPTLVISPDISLTNFILILLHLRVFQQNKNTRKYINTTLCINLFNHPNTFNIAKSQWQLMNLD